MINFKLLNNEEMIELIYKGKSLPSIKTNDGIIRDFHYFCVRDITNWSQPDDVKYLIAYVNKLEIKNVIGIIKYAWYHDTYIGINYIDIRVDYKLKGVATALIKELNNHIVDKYIVISILSEEGKAAKINEVFKRNLVCKAFDRASQLADFIYESRQKA